MKRLKNLLANCRIFLLLLGGLLALLSPSLVAAQGGSSYTITVKGLGTASAKPDLISCEVGVEIVDSDATSAYDDVISRLEDIRSGLEALEIPSSDIQLLRIVVIPQDRTDAGIAPTGEFLYRARGALQVVVHAPASLAGVLSAAVQAGAQSVDNFTFGFQNTDQIEQVARVAAINNAYSRAEQLATVMSVAVGDPIIITEDTVEMIVAGTPYGAAPNMTISPYAITAGEVTVKVEVTITFALRSVR